MPNDNGDRPDEHEEPQAVTLQHSALRRVNFASAQNDVSIIEGITVENPTDEALTDIRITLRATPPIIREKTWTIDRVAPRSYLAVRDLSTPLDIARLEGLNEAEIGELEFRLEAQGLLTIVEKRRIELLARDEWGGVRDMAQILAAFVSPNDPAVARILKDASCLLEAAGHDGSMSGYQSGDPRRAYLLAGAIWSAATGLGLTYAEPPASFEREGQKIRGPGRMTDEGLATCLDSTLFLAAAFEAAGLNPVVLFAQEHALVGVWIFKKDFDHVTEPDVVAVRKAVQAHEFVPIETTLLTKRPAIGFDQAVDEGRRRLSENRDPEFVMAVDIARSRTARIRPLASHRVAVPSQLDAVDEAASAALPPVPDFGLLPSEISEEAPETPRDRIERWQRKLLDLSLRNRLLNYRDSKQTLPLRCLSLAAFEDELAAGKSFRGFSLSDNDPFGNRTVSPEDAQRIEEEVIRDAFERGQVVVPLTGQDMNNRLLTLYRRARNDMQEGGTNTLFLAAGFLRWKKTESDTRTYRAPLVLIPVRLERRSAQSPFRITHHEDDVRVNSTLLEFLKRDFDLRISELEGELPRDENGIDVPLMFDIMRRKVRDIAGFEVVEDLALSTFSFAKYLMWKDLVDRSDQLRQNRLVSHLIDGSQQTHQETNGNTPFAAEEIDRRCLPRDLLAPLPADSSQLAAVLASSEGRDFILVGPPGTGKSQTITNIIAQCLGEGKTVLFVAEKAAALDVVHRRLVATGLADAVLELHSNKTDRKSVLAQLGRGWDRVSGGTEEKWIEVTESLRLSRDRLNSYVEALHTKGSQGFSVFDAVASVATGEPPFEISFASKDAHDEQSYKHLVNLAVDLGRTYAVVGTGPPLSLIRGKEWSFQWEMEVLVAIESLRTALEDLRRTEHVLARKLGLRSDPNLEAGRRARLKALAPRVGQGALDLSSVPELPADRLTALTESFATNVKEFAAASSETVATYPLDAVRRMPLEQLDRDWRQAQAKIWPASVLGRKKVQKLLQTYVDNGVADPAVDLRALFKMRECDAAIRESPLAAIADTGAGPDADRAMEAVRQAIECRATLGDLGSDIEDPVRFRSATSAFVSASERSTLDALRDYLATEKAADDKVREFMRKDGVFLIGSSVADFDAGLATVVAERARLGDWAKWVEQSQEGLAAGLGSLVGALEDGRIERDAGEAFKRAYAAWWLPLAMDASDELRRFTHWDHENIIATFCKLDDTVSELAPVEVMRRIAHGLPAKDNVPRKSKLGVLRYQLGLVRPSMPIRQLLASLPGTLGKLTPCVLMSPLSVAQYLPTDQATFDVVIFDEASQITTWDAIGAIARGRQTIVVGDPKQLPPTNFFGRADDEDEDLPEVERDMPSILDEVSIAGVPHCRLNWHYRSRDEALIAFSNHFYYDGGLITFPAPSAGSDAIKFHRVNGTYARGRGRTNEEEAKAIAEMVKQRLKTWSAIPEDERQTLGVITFNAEQQSLILDLLDEIRRGDSELEWFFADEREEPVIVKNLENIQGDERDVILFSVTFGPDLAGKLTMNFGAINGMGGEKRLNVAITRARRELHLFSSIRAEQIDLDRTHALGVKHLKAFLDYADRGVIALPSRDEGSLGPAESPFEEAVADALGAKGWEVRTQIGVSGFRVDLSVVHPDHAGSYLAGIECDGATYHSSRNARDRDKIRQSVLEGLGWTILRVWSTDWFRNPLIVAERLHDRLKQLLEEDRQARATLDDEADKQTMEAELPMEPTEGAAVVQPVLSGLGHDKVALDEETGAGVEEERPRLIAGLGSVSGTVLAPDSETGSADKVKERETGEKAEERERAATAKERGRPAKAAVKGGPSSAASDVKVTPKQKLCLDYILKNPGCPKLAPAGLVSGPEDRYATGYACINALIKKGLVEAQTVEEGGRKKYALYPTQAASGGALLIAAPSQLGPSVEEFGSPSAGEVASAHPEDAPADPDRFFDFEYAPVLRRLIHRIVGREGPITLHGLVHRVAQEHGWQRAGRRIQARVRKNLGLLECHSEFETVFVWESGSHSPRVPFRGLNGRPIREVSRTEISSVIDAHADDLANEEDPILTLSRLIGIARLSKDARVYLSTCTRWREESATEGINWRTMAKSVPFDKWPLHEKLGYHLQELIRKAPQSLEESRVEILELVSLMGDSAYPSESPYELVELTPLALPLHLFSEANLSVDFLVEPFGDLRSLRQDQFRERLPNLASFLEILRNS